MAYSDVVLADGPIAYWQMQEASGNLADSSGNGYTATANGNPVYRAAGPERIGGFGITFDDNVTMDYFGAELTTINTASGAEVMVEMWFRWRGDVATSLSSELFAFRVPPSFNYAIWIKNRTPPWLGFNTWNDDAFGINTVGNIAANYWYLGHFAFKEGNRAGCRMWINGVEKSPLTEPDGAGDGSIEQIDPTIYIGAGEGPAHGMTGEIAHVAVYNKWLSQARIDAHWNAAQSELWARHGTGMGRW